MKLPVKKNKTNELKFHWDKEQQIFSEHRKDILGNKNIKRDVNDYVDFLSELGLGNILFEKEKPVDKKFIL